MRNNAGFLTHTRWGTCARLLGLITAHLIHEIIIEGDFGAETEDDVMVTSVLDRLEDQGHILIGPSGISRPLRWIILLAQVIHNIVTIPRILHLNLKTHLDSKTPRLHSNFGNWRSFELGSNRVITRTTRPIIPSIWTHVHLCKSGQHRIFHTTKHCQGKASWAITTLNAIPLAWTALKL